MISSLMKKRKIPELSMNPWIPESLNNRSNPWRVGKYDNPFSFFVFYLYFIPISSLSMITILIQNICMYELCISKYTIKYIC